MLEAGSGGNVEVITALGGRCSAVLQHPYERWLICNPDSVAKALRAHRVLVLALMPVRFALSAPCARSLTFPSRSRSLDHRWHFRAVSILLIRKADAGTEFRSIERSPSKSPSKSVYATTMLERKSLGLSINGTWPIGSPLDNWSTFEFSKG